MIQNISVHEAQEKIEKEGAILIDVREQDEFDACSIKGAILVPLSTLAESIKEIDIPADRQVVLQCRKGGRSLKAGMMIDMLSMLPNKSFFNMQGGITEWETQGLPVIKKD